MPSIGDSVRSLIDEDPMDVNLKWVFDYVRNHSLAAVVMVAGVYLVKHGALVSEWPGAGWVFGLILASVGFGLFILNLLQPIVVFSKRVQRSVPFVFISVVYFYAASEFFWVFIDKASI